MLLDAYLSRMVESSICDSTRIETKYVTENTIIGNKL